MIKRLWVIVLLVSASALPAAAKGFTAQGAEERLIVAFQEGVSADQQRQVAEEKGLEVLDSIPEMRVLLVRAPKGRVTTAEFRLMADTNVLMVGKDMWRNWLESEPVSFQGTPLPRFTEVFKKIPSFVPSSRAARGMTAKADSEVPWGVKRVNAPAAWPTNKGAGVKVAVIDTGIDPNHPDLKVAGGYNALDKDQPWHDDHFHGTHVAGTIAATINNAHVAGVAPEATLYAVKVLSKDGSGGIFSIMGGINWVAQNGIQVGNMSLGAPQEIPFLQYAIQMARSAGTIIIAAAGNDGKAVNWPAAYPETLAVSALCPEGVTNAKLCTSTAGGIATFSSRGPEVDVIAPGVLIPSTVPLRHDASGVKAYSGTSMACPHVAGLAALAVAAGATTPDAVVAKLKGAASPLPGLSSNEQGAGLIDAAKLAR